MADLDLRLLSLGEILDRTFTLYRRHFLLFMGITAFPHLLILGLNLAQTLFVKMPVVPVKPHSEQFQGGPSSGLLAFGVVGAMNGDRERFLESFGADGHLEKSDFDSAQLVTQVRELIA